MKTLDPHLKDGVHEWRDGKCFVKEGAKLYLKGTDTLAGRCVPPHLRHTILFSHTVDYCLSIVTLDSCVQNFSLFTGCSLGEAINCVTLNPAR